MKALLRKIRLPPMPDIQSYWPSIVEKHWLPYYQSLAERERRIVLFTAVVLPMVLLVFAVILPLNDAHQNKQLTLHALQQQVIEAEGLAARLQGQGGVQTHGSVMSVVDQVARATHVRQFMTRLRPQIGGNDGQRLLIQMRDAPYDKTMLFFRTLPEKGLSLIQVKLQQAEHKGYIHVQAVIQ